MQVAKFQAQKTGRFSEAPCKTPPTQLGGKIKRVLGLRRVNDVATDESTSLTANPQLDPPTLGHTCFGHRLFNSH